MDTRPIGVFDSGLGGISVLRNMCAMLPAESFVYYGDNKNAPYGTRSEEEILDLAQEDVNFLLRYQVKAIVIACNTATSAAAKTLRETMDMPIIGMEPALKPASLLRKTGIIAVLATPATLRQNKFRLLMQKYGEHAVPVPCAGLVEFVERGEIEGERLEAYLLKALEPFQNTQIDALVLGCTHYVFLKNTVQKLWPGIPLVDGNDGTARQLKHVLEERGLLSDGADRSVRLFTSGDSEKLLPLMQKLLNTTPL